MFFHWLFSLLICVCFTAWIIKPEWTTDLYRGITGGLSQTRVLIIGIVLLVIYVILTVIQACTIFHREKREDRGFITVDSSDSGKVRIAVSAVEQMVRQSVTHIDGIADMRISIENKDDAIGIDIVVTLQNGCHVPTITMNMQRAIRQFVEMNCGVAVRTVSISINAVASTGEGLRRRGRRRDGTKPADMPTPVFSPTQPEYDAPAESGEAEPVIESVGATETEPADDDIYVERPSAYDDEPVESAADEAERAPEEVVIPDPEPIRLHFDHLPEQVEATHAQASEDAEIPDEQ